MPPNLSGLLNISRRLTVIRRIGVLSGGLAFAASFVVQAQSAASRAPAPIHEPASQPAQAVVLSAKNSPPRFISLQFNCNETVKPDVVVVSGAITAKSVRPKDATDQISKQLVAMRAYVQTKGGALVELERLRAARNPDAERRDGDKLPFLQLQKIDVEFPISADIDDALEQLFKLGLDRYGKDLRVEGYDSSREFKNLTSYRIRDLDGKVQRMVQQCVDAETRRACGAQKAKVCAGAVQMHQVYVRAINVATTGYGGRVDRQLRTSFGAAGEVVEGERLELISAAPVRLAVSGSQTLPQATVE